MSKRKFIPKLVLIIIFLFLFSACTGDEKPDSLLQKIVVSNNSNLSMAPLYIALEEGYFLDEGLDVELFSVNRSSEAIAGMIGGDIDVVSVSNSVAILNTIILEDGIKVVADRSHISKDDCSYYSVVIGKEYYDSGEITGPEDMINYKIRSKTTGVSGYFMTLYLAEAGLKLEDMDLSDIPMSAIPDALNSQMIAASPLVEPNLSKVIHSNIGIAVAGLEDYIDDFQISILVYGKSLIIEDRDLGVSFMKAYLKGVKQYNDGKTARNLEIIAKYIGSSEEELENTCWPSIWEDGHISYESFIDYQEWAVSIGDLDAIVPEKIFWDSYFTTKAYALLNE